MKDKTKFIISIILGIIWYAIIIYAGIKTPLFGFVLLVANSAGNEIIIRIDRAGRRAYEQWNNRVLNTAINAIKSITRLICPEDIKQEQGITPNDSDQMQ